MSNQQARQKVVLVTGASSGIGKTTAEYFAARGYQVFGTSRQPASTDAAVEMVQLDVTDEQSVVRCVEQVVAKAGQIDILINNAGMALQGSFEDASDAEIKHQFEVNVFGVVRMIKAVLPHMRKQQSGRIINFSSIVGYAAIPFLSYYSSSKYAIEGISEALYHEVLPHGIKLSIIQPGVVKTDFFNNGLTSSDTIADYRPDAQQLGTSLNKKIDKGIAVEKVARVTFKAATCRSPKRRYTVGPDAVMVAILRPFVPEFIFSLIWHREFGLS